MNVCRHGSNGHPVAWFIMLLFLCKGPAFCKLISLVSRIRHFSASGPTFINFLLFFSLNYFLVVEKLINIEIRISNLSVYCGLIHV